MKKICLIFILIFIFTGVANAGDLMENFPVREIKEMNMSGLMPNYKGSGNFVESETPDFNLSRMKSVNPDFTTYPNENGIIWLKYSDIASSSNGLEITRLYVILGRKNLDKKWLEWNIQIPAGGEAEILLAEVYDFNTLNKILDANIQEHKDIGIKNINFMGLPDVFILAVAWKEILPKQLSVEGLCWFQEDLRVWESVVDVASAQELKYKTFPAIYPVEREFLDGEYSYVWRRINIDPYSSNELARFQRQGVIFGSRNGSAALTGLLKEIDDSVEISAPAEAGNNPQKIISWLMKQPEIKLAEGMPRKIPSLSQPLTKREKILLAKSWLNSNKIDAFLDWQMPFEFDDNTPLCSGMFFAPVLEYMKGKESNFHDMGSPALLAGAKIYGLNSDKLTSRRIPESKSSENRMSAIMDLQLSKNGLLNGSVRILLRGAWANFLLDDNNDYEAAVLALFPDLKNYSDVKFRNFKGVPELSFKISDKPGVAGSGNGILAVLPFFEPVAVWKLAKYEPPIDILFPFIIDQNINIAFPENASEALISGKSAKNADKINYSHAYNNNRKRRLTAEARLEVGLQNISGGNMNLLTSCLQQWQAFSSRNIPIR
ncbi:MAG: hypothetical protein IJ859_05190 [Synergistaceae bacterium]|nr:hypothetical protein [Synergistaceae bacterium]